MSATTHPGSHAPPHDPAPAGDPACTLAASMAAALAEATEIALVAARLAGRLAAMEDKALRTLDETADAATVALVDPPNLGAAIQAGRDADTCEAARIAGAPRIATVNQTVALALRTLRRTLALQARFASGRLLRPTAPGNASPGNAKPRARTAPDADPDAERPERPESPDRPELGDEFAAETDADLHRAVNRGLVKVAAAVDRLAERATWLSPPPPTPTAAQDAPPAHPPGPTAQSPDPSPGPSARPSPGPSPETPAGTPPPSTTPPGAPDG